MPMAGASSPQAAAPINAPVATPLPPQMSGAMGVPAMAGGTPQGAQVAQNAAQSPQLIAQALQRMGGGQR